MTRTQRLQSFYEYVFRLPRDHTIIVNYDEIPASLAGLLGNATTLEHRGTDNVMVSFNEQHFKRMGTLIASLAVRRVGDTWTPIPIKPALILKLNSQKTIANPNHLQVVGLPTGVINADYMQAHFIPDLQAQLQALGGKILVVMDSASSHISKTVINSFHKAGCYCAVIPGGLTMFVQSIDVALASKYREEHHRLYCTFIEGRNKLTCAESRDAFVDLTYKGYIAAVLSHWSTRPSKNWIIRVNS